jgi:site-specific recombinase XerD
MTTEEILERFYNEYIRYHGISGERWRAQRRLLLEFDATLDGRTLAEVTQGDFQSFAGALLDSGLHVNTVRKKLNMIRPLYSWAYAAGVVDAETYLRLKQVKNPRGSSGNSIPQPYTRKDLDRFWSELESAYKLMPAKGPGSQSLKRWLTKGGGWTHVRRHAMRLQLEAMVRLALDCGMRRSEIFGLTLDDMHYENEYIVVRGKADPTTGLPKVRSVPVTGDARAAIKQWVEFRTLLRPTHNSPWLVLHRSAMDPVGPMGFTRFKTLLQHTVGPDWRWHRFRHTAATEWLRAGADLEVVSALLGHATLQQTLGYAAILKSDIAKKLGKVEAKFSEAVTNRAA